MKPNVKLKRILNEIKAQKIKEYAVFTVYCLNREKFATGVKTTPCYLSEPTRQICARISRTFFKRLSTCVYRKKFLEAHPPVCDDKCTVSFHPCICRVDVSPTDVSPTKSWMLRPLNKASLGYCAPDQSVPILDCIMHGSHKAGSTAAIRLPIGYRRNWPNLTQHNVSNAYKDHLNDIEKAIKNQNLGMGWFAQGQGRGHIGQGRTNIAPNPLVPNMYVHGYLSGLLPVAGGLLLGIRLGGTDGISKVRISLKIRRSLMTEAIDLCCLGSVSWHCDQCRGGDRSQPPSSSRGWVRPLSHRPTSCTSPRTPRDRR